MASLFTSANRSATSVFGTVTKLADVATQSVDVLAHLSEAAAAKSQSFRDEVVERAKVRSAMGTAHVRREAIAEYVRDGARLTEELSALGISDEDMAKAELEIFGKTTMFKLVEKKEEAA